MEYDALVDLLHTAEQTCEASNQLSKAIALRNLQEVLREQPEVSKLLQRKMATKLQQKATANA